MYWRNIARSAAINCLEGMHVGFMHPSARMVPCLYLMFPVWPSRFMVLYMTPLIRGVSVNCLVVMVVVRGM